MDNSPLVKNTTTTEATTSVINDTFADTTHVLNTTVTATVEAIAEGALINRGHTLAYVLLPIAVVTAAIGGLYLALLLSKRRRNHYEQSQASGPFVAGARYNWEVVEDPDDWERGLLEDTAVYRPTTDPLTPVVTTGYRPRLLLDLRGALSRGNSDGQSSLHT